MPRRIFQLVASLIFLLAAFTPLAECFDHWDGKATVPANDTELRLTIFFAGAGALLTLAQLMRYVPVLVARSLRPMRLMRAGKLLVSVTRETPAATPSPPPIPLRI